ncbi:rhodanese-like domain-containing protein [Streptococcus hongkongensis]|nr:rhodanese [Streptococcus uberis]
MFKSESITQLQELLKQDKLNLIDVRESFEYEAGHVPSAVNMPLSDFEESYQTLDKNKSYHIICHSGGRSAQACAYLSNQGFEDVTNVEGGTSAWTGKLD